MSRVNPFDSFRNSGTRVDQGHPQSMLSVTPEAGTGHQFIGNNIATLLYIAGGDGTIGVEDAYGNRTTVPVFTADTYLYLPGSFRRVFARSDASINIIAFFSRNPEDLNDEPPEFTSAATATALPEGTLVPTSQVVYTAIAEPDVTGDTVEYDLFSSIDGRLFQIDRLSGEVTFVEATTPDFDRQENYRFTVQASVGGQRSSLAVTIPVTNT